MFLLNSIIGDHPAVRGIIIYFICYVRRKLEKKIIRRRAAEIGSYSQDYAVVQTRDQRV